MKYLKLEELYAYFPQLATVGQSDEALRLIIEDCEQVVEGDLETLGFSGPYADERSKAQLRRLVLFRVLAEVLVHPSSPVINPQLAQYYESKYRMELRDLALKPSRLPGAQKVVTDLPAFAPRRKDPDSLLERVRRWILL